MSILNVFQKLAAKRIWSKGCRWPIDERMETVVAGKGASTQGHDNVSFYTACGRHGIARWMANTVLGLNTSFFESVPLDTVTRWAHIDSKLFWQALAQRWPTQAARGPSQWTQVMVEAANFGALAPLEAAGQDRVGVLAKYNRRHWLGYANHPRVGLWMVENGLETKEALCAQVNARTFPLEGNCFAAVLPGMPMHTPYLRDWCVSYLRDYGLSHAQKARIVGQALMAFGESAWDLHLSQACAPFLGDVDVPLLKRVCGVGDGHGPLHEAMVLLTQDFREAFDPRECEETMGRIEHLGLLLLMQARPPKSRLDLYFLGMQVQAIERDMALMPHGVVLPDLG